MKRPMTLIKGWVGARIILQDEKGICWKFNMTEDMKLVEILTCVEHQFYAKEKESAP